MILYAVPGFTAAVAANATQPASSASVVPINASQVEQTIAKKSPNTPCVWQNGLYLSCGGNHMYRKASIK